MNKIEQVARAIKGALEDPFREKSLIDMAKLNDEEMKEFISNSLARAAIKAMRVPTDGMVCRGETLSDFVLAEGFDNSIEARRAEMKGAFVSMIDAALEGK